MNLLATTPVHLPDLAQQLDKFKFIPATAHSLANFFDTFVTLSAWEVVAKRETYRQPTSFRWSGKRCRHPNLTVQRHRMRYLSASSFSYDCRVVQKIPGKKRGYFANPKYI